jgi:hypothetical protein
LGKRIDVKIVPSKGDVKGERIKDGNVASDRRTEMDMQTSWVTILLNSHLYGETIG